MQAIRTAVRTNLPVYRAPPALAMRIGSALPREAPPVAMCVGPAGSTFVGTALAGGLMAGGLAGRCADAWRLAGLPGRLPIR